jgi:hypothetical protein
MNNLTTREGVEVDQFHPNLLPPPLPQKDALRLAVLARVPPEEHESFFDMVHWAVALVWMRDIRAIGGEAGSHLRQIAEAARTLHQELGRLDPISQKWVERLRRRTFWYNELLRDVPETVFRLAHLFSSAAGMSPPRGPGVAAPEHQKSDRDKTREDVMFLDFACRLKMVARETGGRLGLDPDKKGGTLFEAVYILEPHLPDGVVPERDKFPFSALKKIKVGTLAMPIAEIDFYSPEPSA